MDFSVDFHNILDTMFLLAVNKYLTVESLLRDDCTKSVLTINIDHNLVCSCLSGTSVLCNVVCLNVIKQSRVFVFVRYL